MNVLGASNQQISEGKISDEEAQKLALRLAKILENPDVMNENPEKDLEILNFHPPSLIVTKYFLAFTNKLKSLCKSDRKDELRDTLITQTFYKFHPSHVFCQALIKRKPLLQSIYRSLTSLTTGEDSKCDGIDNQRFASNCICVIHSMIFFACFTEQKWKSLEKLGFFPLLVESLRLCGDMNPVTSRANTLSRIFVIFQYAFSLNVLHSWDVFDYNLDLLCFQTVNLFHIYQHVSWVSKELMDEALFGVFISLADNSEIPSIRQRLLNNSDLMSIANEILYHGVRLSDALHSVMYVCGTSFSDCKSLKPSSRICSLASCGAKGSVTKLRCCSGCRIVWYCSKICQKSDWKNHKTVCKVAQRSNAKSK